MKNSDHTIHKRNIFQSTIARIVVVVIVLVLPINIMTLLLSNMVLSENRKQLAAETKNALEMKVSTFEDVLDRASKRLLFMCFNETTIITLAQKGKDIAHSELSSNLVMAREELKDVRQEYHWVDQVFFTFPESELVLMDGYTGIDYKNCRSMVENAQPEEGTQNGRWEFRILQETPILFGVSSWRGSNFGVIVNLEWALGSLELDQLGKERTAFFTNLEETRFTGAGAAYMEETNMTLEELRQSGRYQVYTVPMEKYGLKLIEVVEWNAQARNLPVAIYVVQVVSVGLTLLVIPLLLLYIHRQVNQPLRRLERAIDRIEAGDLGYRIRTGNEGREFEQINRSFNDMMEQVQELKIGVYEKELERKDIKMRYLSQQIQPHFILNAMNILYSYEPEEYPLIQKMVLCISKYFRYIVKVNAAFVTLKQEMDHIRNYFEIQKARFPELFFSIVEYEEGLADALIPPLLIQNFAENAIKHSLKIGNKINIYVIGEYHQEEDGQPMFRVRLADTGEGISDEVEEKIRIFQETGRLQEGLGVGIQNSIERLKYLYSGKKSHLRIWRDEHYSGTNVELIMPLFYAEEGVEYDENFTGRR